MKEIDKKIRNEFGLKFVEDIEGSMKEALRNIKLPLDSFQNTEYRKTFKPLLKQRPFLLLLYFSAL